MTTELDPKERRILLEIARRTLQDACRGEKPAPLKLEDYPPALREIESAFVTLTKKGTLRGCVGSIEASQPLVQEVRERAIGAGFQDYRFPPLTVSELDQIEIEISRLTKPQRLEYETPQELLEKLHPGKDGVILRHSYHRATFLPQVWDQLPDKELFLSRLCLKMGLTENAWKQHHLEVEIYHVEHFQEEP
jgi:AmmeMemoRadiSam system protein A